MSTGPRGVTASAARIPPSGIMVTERFGVAVIALFAFIAAKRLPQREVLPADAATEPGPSTAEAPSPLAVG